MKGPSLQKTTALSAALHLTFFFVAALVLRQSNSIVIPSPYVVSLVGPAISSKGSVTENTTAKDTSEKKAVEPIKQPTEQKEATVKDTRADQKRVEDRLSELKAKKNVERIVGLRTKVLSIKGSEGKLQSSPAAQKAGGGRSQGTLFDSYYAKITQQIWQEWVYPDTGDKNLEAVVAVKIAKDGSLSVQGIEKKSGNTLFDRSALRAIAKASPVAPPPYEMEIGMRFYP
ncbi:MAG: cell envelope integrity protein TolA [Nitrospirae bacterium]|nr:cell envelope integrity protein TolA [Nitrospirota bacterium]